jgi:hypothetical protein
LRDSPLHRNRGKLQTIFDDERNPRLHQLFSRRQTLGYADGLLYPSRMAH